MKSATLLLVACLFAPGQDSNIRVTAQTLSGETARSMFGRLPKGILAVRAGVCNQTEIALTVPLERINQQASATNGITVLPHDVAFIVIAAAQGNSAANKWLRGAVAAVQLAAIAASWSGLSPTVNNTLTSVALVGTSTIGVLGAAISSHAYLQFDHASLPDPLSLAPLGCVTGVALVEDDSAMKLKARRIDFSMPVRAVSEGGR